MHVMMFTQDCSPTVLIYIYILVINRIMNDLLIHTVELWTEDITNHLM